MTIEDIALTMTPGLGARGIVHLLDRFGSAAAIFAASQEELVVRAELRPDLAAALATRRGFAAAEREWSYCMRHDITPVASTDESYPPLLRETNDYPHILYIKGNPAAVAGRTLSVVGTRGMTPYGQRACNQLIGELAERTPEVTIVSGLALGIDGEAHRAALAAGLQTVGVVANALPSVTPAQHERLAREMIDRGGAVISEMHSQSKQNGKFYPMRNRIIAGLSAGTLVVESDIKGGSLLTVQYADGYGRTVMAVPGRITDKYSRGTNNLICNMVAHAIRSADDILRELGWDLELPKVERPAETAAETADLTRDERVVLECFRTDEPLSIRQLEELSGMDAGTLNALLVGLELTGAVRKLPGNRYERFR